MFDSVHEFESLVADILIRLNSNESYRNLYELYGSQKVNEALCYCSKENLITGVFPMRTASNDVHIDFTSSPRVTVKGLQYIEDFNGEDTSTIAKNALKKAKKADITSKIALILSTISIIASILANLDKIVENVLLYLN